MNNGSTRTYIPVTLNKPVPYSTRVSSIVMQLHVQHHMTSAPPTPPSPGSVRGWDAMTGESVRKENE